MRFTIKTMSASRARGALKTAAIGAACSAIACSALLAPMIPSTVRLSADYTAPNGSGYATFRGRVSLSGRVSAWSRLFGRGVDPSVAELALRLAVSEAIARAGSDALSGQASPLRAWALSLSRRCESAMSEMVGGVWSAEPLDYELSPGAEPARGGAESAV